MTVRDIIEAADSLRSNRLDTALKIKALSSLDERIFNDIVLRHKNEQAPPFPYESDERELLAPRRFAKMYEAFLCSEIDYALGETALFLNDLSLFENEYARFAASYHEHNTPPKPCAVHTAAVYEGR